MSVTELVSGETTFHIVGTAHVSQRSVDEVRQVIADRAPDVVCVELDAARHAALTKASAFRDLDVTKVVREGRALYVLAHLALTAYQRRIGASLGVRPGAELLAAIDAARAAGIPVALIDRDINVTLKRTWRNVGAWQRVTLLASLLFGSGLGKTTSEPITAQTIDDLQQPKALSDMLSELGRVIPQIKGPLIDERDQYLAAKMVDAGRGRRTVVAVVGAAHVAGMRAQLGQPVDYAALERVPPPALVWRAIKWLIPILFLTAILWRSTSLLPTMLAWILPTSIAAGGFTLLAGGSLLATLSAIVVSPIAALVPPLGTGMVTGVVEAWRRKPSASDRERLLDDLQSLRGLRRNPVTRILLVALASGLGTAIGFWVGVGWVATRL